MILDVHPSLPGNTIWAEGTSFVGYWSGGRDLGIVQLPDPHD